MSKLLRFLFTGIAIIIIAFWIFTVLRTCQTDKATDKNLNQSPTELTTAEDPSSEEPETDDPGDIDFADAVKSGAGKEDANSSSDKNGNASEEGPKDMETTGGRRLTDATAGSDNSPFLVIAGTYTSEGNAKSEVKRLQGLGYADAEVVQFIGSRFYTVCVDRMDDLGAARRLRKKVKAANTEEVYVHRRRLPKRK